jgi:hypothetical protein
VLADIDLVDATLVANGVISRVEPVFILYEADPEVIDLSLFAVKSGTVRANTG